MGWVGLGQRRWGSVVMWWWTGSFKAVRVYIPLHIYRPPKPGFWGSADRMALFPLDEIRFFCSHCTVWVKNPPWGLMAIVPKRLRIFQPNFTHLLCVPVYARPRIFIQLSATLTKLCHIKRDHPVHIMCAKCPPLAKTHCSRTRTLAFSGIFPKQLVIFSPNFY